MSNDKRLWVAVVAVAIIAVGAYFYPQQAAGLLGAVGTRFPNGLAVGTTSPAQGKLLIGTNGTNIGNVNFQTCSLILASYTLAASSTVTADCAVTGAQTGDVVFAQFATTTPGAGTGAGWLITGASASTTAGFDTLSVINNTGTSAVIPASVASTTKVLNIR